MQPPEVNLGSQEPEEERGLRWFLGLLPYGSGWYRTLMALGTGTVLMGGAVRALMPEARTWPLEQFHVRSRERQFAPSRIEAAEMDFPEFTNRRSSAGVRALARPDGARLISETGSSLPIRVLPTPVAPSLPSSRSLRGGDILPPEATLPAAARELPRRRIPLGREGIRPLGGVRGRSVSGGEEAGSAGFSGAQQVPIIGARHEYESQTTQEVVGSQLRPFGTQGRPAEPNVDAQGTWGGDGMPARERVITAIRLVPEQLELEVGTSQAFDLQIQLDRSEWFSVTHWPETQFRLLTTNAGIEQHRQADNVLLALLETPERLHGSQVLFEGSLRLPGRGAPLTARALVRVRIPQAERSEALRPGLGSRPRLGR